MFLISFINFIYSFLCIFTILLVLLQKGKGNMGLGHLGSNSQVFGATGGNVIMQQATWVCCALLLGGSFLLATLRARIGSNHSVVTYHRPVSEIPDQAG